MLLEQRSSGLGNHSYCRSPNNFDVPWCFTEDPIVQWQECNVPQCQKSNNVIPKPSTASTTKTTTSKVTTTTPITMAETTITEVATTAAKTSAESTITEASTSEGTTLTRTKTTSGERTTVEPTSTIVVELQSTTQFELTNLISGK